jgi:hypothetical protein
MQLQLTNPNPHSRESEDYHRPIIPPGHRSGKIGWHERIGHGVLVLILSLE